VQQAGLSATDQRQQWRRPRPPLNMSLWEQHNQPRVPTSCSNPGRIGINNRRGKKQRYKERRQVGREKSNTLVLSATNGQMILFPAIWPGVNPVLHLRPGAPLTEGWRGTENLACSSVYHTALTEATGRVVFRDTRSVGALIPFGDLDPQAWHLLSGLPRTQMCFLLSMHKCEQFMNIFLGCFFRQGYDLCLATRGLSLENSDPGCEWRFLSSCLTKDQCYLPRGGHASNLPQGQTQVTLRQANM